MRGKERPDERTVKRTGYVRGMDGREERTVERKKTDERKRQVRGMDRHAERTGERKGQRRG